MQLWPDSAQCNYDAGIFQNIITTHFLFFSRNENAFICHYRDHWFSIRKLGSQWFNLNSILSGPELLSDTYLSLFLAQLQTDKYSIFIVIGDLPSCEADKVLSLAPLSPRHFRKAPTKKQEPEEDDEQLKAALAMSWKEMEEGDDQEALNKAILQSLQSSQPGQELPAAIAPEASISTVDEDLKRAISLSLSQDHGETSSSTAEASTSSAISDSVEFIRQRRLLRLGQSATSPNNPWINQLPFLFSSFCYFQCLKYSGKKEVIFVSLKKNSGVV